MIAQIILTALLGGILCYAWTEHRRSPAIGLTAGVVASGGLYFVWLPAHATALAELAGVGRGVDLIIYVWVVISLLVALNLHLKLRADGAHNDASARDYATQCASQTGSIARPNNDHPVPWPEPMMLVLAGCGTSEHRSVQGHARALPGSIQSPSQAAGTFRSSDCWEAHADRVQFHARTAPYRWPHYSQY